MIPPVFGEAPLSAELLNAEQLEERGRELSAEHAGFGVAQLRTSHLLDRLAANEGVIREACLVLASAVKAGHRATPAGEWLLDNLYLIDEQVRLARTHLPRRYSEQLPALAEGPSAGLPRIYDLMLKAISHGDGRFDEASLRRYLAAYQERLPLTLGELWAVPIMLRLALVENLRRVAVRVRQGRIDRNLAVRWADAMVDATRADPTRLILVAADMARDEPPMSQAFVSELTQRLKPLGDAMSLPMTWIEQRLAESGLTSAQLVQGAQHEQVIDQVSASNCIGSLRLLDALDWKAFVEAVSHVERVLREDPAGVYARMDFATRNHYRRVVEHLARRSGRDERELAADAVALAAGHRHDPDERLSHVGYYLVDRGREQLEARVGLHARLRLPRSPRARVALHLGTLVLLTVAFVATLEPALVEPAPAWWLLAVVTGAAVIAASELALTVANHAAARLARPSQLPRLDFPDGIPASARTLVAVPALLTSIETAEELVADLEVRYMGNRDAELHFALLTDFPDAHAAHEARDPAILEAAREAIRELNRRHPSAPFLLLHRARRWNATQRAWIGHERKRGKLVALNRLVLDGDASAFATVEGDIAWLAGVRYVITLDADTRLPRDAARALVATMAHPLNGPRDDAGGARAGYAILQPRVGHTMPANGPSPYAHLFGGETGIDPYTRLVSDTYQDLFGAGSFIGKGIYDVAAFERALAGRLPDNRILSHDLLEGCHARAGLASDIELFEHHPQSYLVDARRRHRWIRGDWQLAAWLLPRVRDAQGVLQRNPLDALSRWKILDNLRRSLLPLALLVLLFAAWQVPEWRAALVALVLAVFVLPVALDVLQELLAPPGGDSGPRHLRRIGAQAMRRAARAAFVAACLPFEAWLSADAIARTLWRLHVSHRNLLEWQTSSMVERAHRDTLAAFATTLWPCYAAAALSIASVVDAGSLPWQLAWLVAPFLAWRLSRSPRRDERRLDARQRTYLRGLARRTWHFFERHVTEADHWLPPDNHQEQPIERTAHRTSPTNIGLYLLSCLAARDFGYVALGDWIERTEHTMRTLERLERHRGHFYNWYDTITLQPLAPAYVSTVDSGNFAAHLMTLRIGLLEAPDEPVIGAAAIEGLRDVLALAAAGARAESRAALEALATRLLPERAGECLALRTMLADAATTLAAAAEDEPGNAWIAAARRQVDAHVVDLAAFVDGATGDVPTLRDVADGGGRCADAARRAIARIEALAARCNEFARPDFGFLYDATRSLFAIGYNVSERRMDAGYYDLLASEARLAVFVAIAQGVVPQDAWFALGRLLTSASGRRVLLSWSGSMFEYLMPQLVMPAYRGTLLEESNHAAVRQQIDYGRSRGVPWGVSESGYNLTDAAQNYQYRAFGVPGLGLERGLSQELVVAPYATMLAMLAAPREAFDNLAAMDALGWLTDHGFYEAVDYTPARMPHGATSVIVRSYMAHHQGMSLLALLSVLAAQPMQRRFAADVELQATLLLLQERVPRGAIDWARDPAMVDVRISSDAPQSAMRVFGEAIPPRPAVQLLGNGRYHVMVTTGGGGYSRWQELALTRWHEDATRDDKGVYVYLRDADSGKVWSATPQPCPTPADASEIVFTEATAEFKRSLDGIETHLQVVVSPEDDIELRRLRIANRSRTMRTIDVTSYAEIVLAPAIADALHPAFSNLFVQTEFVPEHEAILATRRRSTGEQAQHWLLHALAVHDGERLAHSFETDRMAFIGRERSLRAPLAVTRDAPLEGHAGPVLDPIAASRQRVRLAPEQGVTIDLIIGVAESRENALLLADKYRDRHLADRAIEIAWTHSRLALGQLAISEVDGQTCNRLAGAIVFADPARRAAPSTIAANRLAQRGLWPFAISGDHPIVLLQIASARHIELVRQLVSAHAYCRMKGLVFDLVIWNEERIGYRTALGDEILAVVSTSADAAMLERPGGVYVRNLDQLDHEDRVLMLAVARAVFVDADGTLAEQLARDRNVGGDSVVPRFTPLAVEDVAPPRVSATPSSPLPALTFDNGIGGFAADGREYVARVGTGRAPPLPWINVIANPRFGCIVSTAGTGYSWAENAHEYRLSTWSNDPVTDAGGEAIYLRDEDTGMFWSPTPLPAPDEGEYVVRHGFGYTIVEHTAHDITSALRIHVDTEAPVKFYMLRLRNDGDRPRRISVTGYVEWVLGDLREKTAMHVVTELDDSGALLARNAYSLEFPSLVAFFDLEHLQRTLSGDRAEFIGRNGSLRDPAAMRRQTLSGRLGAGMDPCGAIQAPVELAPGESRDLIFRLGVGRDRAEAVALVQRFRRNGSARASIDAVHAQWRSLLGAVRVETPDAALDLLANGWLMYQVIACRLWARSGFYQSGGAFGFRDQLQDAMAAVHADPAFLREQVVQCAQHQFVEGDVQHWWHPPAGRGVRTRCSDDYLWLPLALARYVEVTGDRTILAQQASFLEGRPLGEGEESYYDMPMRSPHSADIYEHCRRALLRGMRYGAHGLPLIGSGDWNDGMNNVGRDGRGESVWLAFFLHDVLRRFEPIARSRGDDAFAQRCAEERSRLADAVERHAWDGGWYLRAYFDDGTPLGSAASRECRIDALSQSWAVLSGIGARERIERALDAVDEQLVDESAGLIRLLDPPFDVSEPDPGYIRGYLPGVRENGGQYTHAAVWTIMAFLEAGRIERAWALFELIDPLRHGADADAIARWKTEPYVVAADVLSIEPHTGRGGWSWYTGSAGWMYRLVVESMLGLQRAGARLFVRPRVPAAWPGFRAWYAFEDRRYAIAVTRRAGNAISTGEAASASLAADAPRVQVLEWGAWTIEVTREPAPARA